MSIIQAAAGGGLTLGEFIAAAAGYADSTAAASVTTPAERQSGDLLVALITSTDRRSPSLPSGYTDQISNQNGRVATRTSHGTEGVVSTVYTGNDKGVIASVVLRSCVLPAVADSAFANDSSPGDEIPAFTFTRDGFTVVAITNTGGSSAPALPSGYTSLIEVGSGGVGTRGYRVCYREQTPGAVGGINTGSGSVVAGVHAEYAMG